MSDGKVRQGAVRAFWSAMDSFGDESSSEVHEPSEDEGPAIISDASEPGSGVEPDQGDSTDGPEATETSDSRTSEPQPDGSGETPDEGVVPGPDRMEVESRDSDVEPDPGERVHEENNSDGESRSTGFAPIFHAYGHI